MKSMIRNLALLAALVFGGASASGWEMTKVNIATPWAAEVTPETVHREYPRPQMVRPEWQNLNGLWQWQSLQKMDSELSAGGWHEILVPFAPEAPLSGIGRHYESMAYRRTFSIPEAWKEQRVLLHFEAVDWRCEAFVDGMSVGTHEGGYDPFEFDITEALGQSGGADEHELILRVFDPTDNDAVPRGKQVLSPGGIFYTCTSGIWQTVWMEAVPKTYIADYRVETDIDKEEVTFTVFAGGNAVPDDTEVTIVVSHGEDLAAIGTGAVGKPITISLPDAELWDPEHPFLYDARIVMGDDAVDTYFGMRKIALQRDGLWYRLAFNNQFLFQMGPLDQGFWPDGIYTAPSDEALMSDIVTMKRMGFNMVRKHIKVEPRRWYYWCDRLGLMVWQDMPGENYGGKGGTNNGDYFNRELTALVETHYNTPSIVMWVIFNEGGGQTDKTYTKRFVDLVRKLDTTRLINEASGWNHYGYGDIKDIHPYPAPTYTTTSYKQAMACGEYGGVQYVLDGHLWSSSHWGYASVESPEELDNTYTEYARKLAYFKTFKGLSAAVYTQLTDVEVEVNGLMSYDRVVKSDLSRLYAANRIAIESEGQEFPYLLSPADESPETWQYTTAKPSTNDWYAVDYDDSEWNTGEAGFGANGLSNMHYGTRWTTADIWIRRTIDLNLTPEELAKLTMRIYYDEDTEVYINGVKAFSATGYITDYKNVTLSAAALAAIDPQGINTLAAHCHQTAGGQFLDIALFIDNSTPIYSAQQAIRATACYSHSSELSFTIGCSQNVAATEPDYTTEVKRIPFAKAPAAVSIGLDDTRLAADQELLFDVSTLLAKVDATKPVKVFFKVNTTKRGKGYGEVAAATYEDASSGTTLVTAFTPQTITVRGGEDTEWMTTVFDPATASPKPDDTVVDTGSLGFEVTPKAVAKGEKVYLKDMSGLPETRIAWQVTGPTTCTLIAGGNTSFVPEAPGRYDVTQLDLADRVELTKTSAFTVCNAPSGMGWSFINGVSVSMPAPLTARSYKYTIDWWMKPEGSTDGCLTMFESSREQFQLTVSSDGTMTVASAGVEASTKAGFVIPDAWHHYAISYYYSRFYFYRDGELCHNTSGPTVTPAWEGEFYIGGSHCVIDEWRFWNNRLTQDRLREVCVAPLANPEAEAASSAALAVYLDFDTKDPIAATANLAVPSNRVSLSRSGEWKPSMGVFCFDFSESTAKDVDVTADYLTNYCAPFLHTDIPANDRYPARFFGLEMNTDASGWEEWNAGSSSLTGAISVDMREGSVMTIQSGWYGTPEVFTDRFLTQWVTLPAGRYTFSVTLDEEYNAWGSYVSVEYYCSPLTDGGSITFTLAHEQTLRLGIKLQLFAFGKIAIRKFTLVRHPVEALEANGETGIQPPLLSKETEETSVSYTLQGIPVATPAVSGVYIRNGRKIIVR